MKSAYVKETFIFVKKYEQGRLKIKMVSSFCPITVTPALILSRISGVFPAGHKPIRAERIPDRPE